MCLALPPDRLQLLRKLVERAVRQLRLERRLKGCQRLQRGAMRHLPRLLPLPPLSDLVRRGRRLIVTPDHARKTGQYAAIIVLLDRVVLVVVAPGTLQTQPQERISHGVRRFREQIRPLCDRIAVVVFVHRRAVKPGGHQRRRIPGKNHVTRQLLLHEPIVRQIAVQRAHHPVAIPPRLRPIRVLLVTVGLRVPHDVQPVARPFLPEPRARQQTVDHTLVRPRRIVRRKRLDLRRRRRQSGQIERHPPQQYRPLHRLRKSLAPPLRLAPQKRVDRRAHLEPARPRRVHDLRRLRPRHRLIRPPRPVLRRQFGAGPPKRIVRHHHRPQNRCGQ